MPSLIAFFLGAIWGGFVAKRRGGNRLDMLQFAAVHGIVLAILALLASVIYFRNEWV